MSHQITVEEAAGQLSALVREVQTGQEIVLLDGSRPVAWPTSRIYTTTPAAEQCIMPLLEPARNAAP